MTLADRLTTGVRRVGAGATRNPHAAAVVLVLAVLPLGGVEVAGYSVVHLAMGLSAVLAVRALVRDDQPVPGSLILLGLGAGIVVSLVAAAAGVNPDSAVTRVVIGFLALGHAVGVVMAYRPGGERAATDLLVVVGGVIAAIALSEAGSLTASAGGWVIEGRLTGPFSQPNGLGIFCAALLPVAVACLVTSGSRRRAVVIGAATACIAAAWALSMSRGAWIGGAAGLVCLAIAVPRSRRVLRRAGAGVLAVCVLAVTLPPSTPLLGILGARLRSLRDPADNEYDARPLIWGEAWRQVSDRPWFGVGPDGYRVASIDSASTVSSYGADHPHDLYLTVLVERGVLGLAAGLLVVGGALLVVHRQLPSGAWADADAETRSARGIAIIAGLLAVAVHGVFDMPLWNPIVYGFVWTLLGMAIVAETAPGRGPARLTARPIHRSTPARGTARGTRTT